MKNLKISKSFKCFVLSGALFVFSGCCLNENTINDYDYNIKNVSQDSYDDYYKYFSLNGLTPFIADGNNEKNKVYGKFVEALWSYPYYDENGDLKFRDDWRLLEDEELRDFTGIARVSNCAYHNVYSVLKTKDGFIKKKVDIEDTKADGIYCIDYNEELVLVDPVSYYFYEGKITNKVKTR